MLQRAERMFDHLFATIYKKLTDRLLSTITFVL
jgi:hypothetical protein